MKSKRLFNHFRNEVSDLCGGCYYMRAADHSSNWDRFAGDTLFSEKMTEFYKTMTVRETYLQIIKLFQEKVINNN